MSTTGTLILQCAGPICVILFQCSAIKTGWEIVQARSVKQYSLLPFVSLFSNSVLWTYYGLLKSDNTVLVPNIFGVVGGGFCVIAYLSNTIIVQKVYLYSMVAILLTSTFLFITGNAFTLGLLGCCLSILVMGSPLATLATVVRDKSTASMPFYTSLAGWLNAFSWSAYGIIVANDMMVRSLVLLLTIERMLTIFSHLRYSVQI
jgi:solute carrier family 50 protein (sugar transporter)